VMQAKMKEGFVVHESFINNRVIEFFATEQQCDERVTMLKSATTELDKSFTAWKPEIESSITSVRLELSKLNSFFDCEAKATSNPSSSVLNIWSASTRSPTGFDADSPVGHHSDTTHWDCGFGSVYTQIHDPFKGTMPPPPPNPTSTQFGSAIPRDLHRSASTFGPSTRLPTSKLPKMNFPKFEGENPKLWQSRCESYFDMYDVDYSIWVKVASMHFEGPAARWLQSVEHRVKTTSWTELCSWIHDRLGREQHELLIRQLYKIKQSESVQQYIDMLCELIDQLQAYSPTTDPLYYTTRFIDGLNDDIKYLISRTWILPAIWHCCRRTTTLLRPRVPSNSVGDSYINHHFRVLYHYQGPHCILSLIMSLMTRVRLALRFHQWKIRLQLWQHIEWPRVCVEDMVRNGSRDTNVQNLYN
jgi:hypothetical protein